MSISLSELFQTPSSVRLQYWLPQHALTRLAGWLANSKGGSLTTIAIKWFIKKYKVNMQEAANPDPKSYDTFNLFFTRALVSNARPLTNATWISPVDGAISQLGVIAENQIYQAKGHTYTVQALLGGKQELAAKFTHGHFACLYLSPKDYHRIHMPCDGTLREMIYVPGDLFSVNPLTAQNVPGLFARNERVVCIFDTAYGALACVLVGATIVGSVATVWHGVVTPPRRPSICTWRYPPAGQINAISLQQGQEMARFLLGSTVVMLWSKTQLAFNHLWQSSQAIRMGEAMATGPTSG